MSQLRALRTNCNVSDTGDAKKSLTDLRSSSSSVEPVTQWGSATANSRSHMVGSVAKGRWCSVLVTQGESCTGGGVATSSSADLEPTEL